MRRTPALIAALALLATMSGCAGSTADDDCMSSGDSSALIEASGDLGSAPEVSFPTPLRPGGVEKSTLIEGDTAPIRAGQPVLLEATISSGDDGTVLQQTSYSEAGGSLFTAGSDQLPALGDALPCSAIGSRIAVVADSEAAGVDGEGAPDSVVYVVDVLNAFPSRATGAPQVAESGMPSVVTAPDGTPGVTIPNEPAPTEYRQVYTRLGDGEKIADDDAVVVKLTAFDWEDNSVSSTIASTWENDSSTILFLGQDADALGEGLVDAIVGAPVGSQVLAVVPPELAGTGGAAGPSTSTLVYVIDVLGTVDA